MNRLHVLYRNWPKKSILRDLETRYLSQHSVAFQLHDHSFVVKRNRSNRHFSSLLLNFCLLNEPFHPIQIGFQFVCPLQKPIKLIASVPRFIDSSLISPPTMTMTAATVDGGFLSISVVKHVPTIRRTLSPYLARGTAGDVRIYLAAGRVTGVQSNYSRRDSESTGKPET